MRWLVVVVLVACAHAPPKQTPPDVDAFYRAADLAKAGKAMLAYDAYTDFIRRYPYSRLRPDATIELADFDFDRGDVTAALAKYREATFPPDDDRGWYVRYRIAWCDLNLGNASEAEREMRAVTEAPPNGRRARTMLIDEAKKDLAAMVEKSADPTYVAADQLYAQQKFCEAAPLYSQVAQSDAREHEEAGYALVLSTISCEHLTDAAPDETTASTPPWQHVLAALDIYIAHAKVVEPAARFRRGQLLYDLHRFSDAAADFRAVIHDAPSDEMAPYARTLLLDCEQQLNQPAAPTTSSRK